VKAPWLAAATLALALVPALARAFDPLWTDPGEMNEGRTLPGDRDPVGAPSPGGSPRVLTLVDAVDQALGRNAALRESWARVKIQAAALGQARTAFLPTLGGSGSKVGDGLNVPAAGQPRTWASTYQASATADWQVFNFGSSFFGDRSAGHLIESAYADHNAALQKALAGVIQDYFDAFTAREVFFGDCRDTEIARGTLASARRREAKGAGTRSESLQATTSLLKLVVQSNRDEGAYHKAVAVLDDDMGAPPDTALAFPEALDEDLRYNGQDLKAWIVEARENHPAIVSAQEQCEAARDAVRAAVAKSLPSFDFSVNYYVNGRPGLQISSEASDELLVAGTVNLSLFGGFADLYRIHDAEARLEDQEARLEVARNDVLRDVVKAYWDAGTAFQNLKASEDLLQAALESEQVARRRFDRHAASLVEVFNAQSALSDARQQRIRCLAQWRSDRLGLLASVGMLGRDAVAPAAARQPGQGN